METGVRWVASQVFAHVNFQRARIDCKESGVKEPVDVAPEEQAPKLMVLPHTGIAIEVPCFEGLSRRSTGEGTDGSHFTNQPVSEGGLANAHAHRRTGVPPMNSRGSEVEVVEWLAER